MFSVQSLEHKSFRFAKSLKTHMSPPEQWIWCRSKGHKAHSGNWPSAAQAAYTVATILAGTDANLISMNELIPGPAKHHSLLPHAIDMTLAEC